MPAFVTRHKLRLAIRGLLASVLGWALIILANWLLGAQLPPGREAQQMVGMFAVVTEFLFLKTWLMVGRQELADRLGWSLIAFNGVFTVGYFLTMEALLLPFLLDWERVSWVIWAAVWIVSLWGIWELLCIDDPPCDDEPRSDGLP